MSTIVKCDVCGQTCSQSYLNSHKRLAHKKTEPAVSTAHEPETVQAILLLYGQLSDRSQEIVRRRILGLGTEASQDAGNESRSARRGKESIQ